MLGLSLIDFKETPYATWVMEGKKDIETRKWKPKQFVNGLSTWDILICCSNHSASEKRGLALCVVELFHIEPMRREHEKRACCSTYYNKHGKLAWSWFFRNRRLLSDQFAVTGALNLFPVEIPAGITLISAGSLYKDTAPIFLKLQATLI